MSDLLEQLRTALGGPYRISHELAGGGMSRVFAAEESGLGRRVAAKVRFRREIQCDLVATTAGHARHSREGHHRATRG